MNEADRGPERRQAVLFLCHHNAVRSQMAEALLRARFPHRYEAASAGTEPAGVHPLTILTLEEIGVSTSELRSKHVEELVGHGFDLVVTVCGHDEPTCPFFPGGRQIHRSFDDPSTVTGADEVRLAAFRATRDEIDAWVKELFSPDKAGAPQRGSMPWVQQPISRLLDAADETVRAALAEDRADRDATSRAMLPRNEEIVAVLRAKAAGIIAGLPIAERVFRRIDARIRFTPLAVDGQDVGPGDHLAEIRGPSRSILAAERTALNFLQRMSGIATATSQYVDAVARTRTLVLDTRKTAPGLRALDKYAVRMGGGANHRMSLADLVLVKDNHADACGGVAEAVKRARSTGPGLPIEVEVRSLDELDLALSLDPLPNAVLLDNMPFQTLREAVARVGERTWTEASGGVTLETIAEIAAAGVDAVSVGALTHSATALDISLDILAPAARAHNAACDVQDLRARLGRATLVLAHHYVRDELLPFADVRGDSLELARAAAASDADAIVLCGVRFMGETAAALARPGQRVFLPRPDAGCYLANCAHDRDVRIAWGAIADVGTAVPLCYVNSSLAVKAFCGEHGGATCTSSNAERVLRWALEAADRVLLLPDRNLALNTARRLSLHESEILEWSFATPPSPAELRRARLVVWPGACCVHQRFQPWHVTDARRRLPGVRVVVHPECDPALARAADAVGSTSQIIQWVEEAPSGSAFAIGTEHRLVLRLASEHRDKTIAGLADIPSFCASMGRIRLGDLRVVLDRLARGEPMEHIEVPPALASAARAGVERMLGLTPATPTSSVR